LEEKVVIGITGLPGSGKSTIARIAKKLGYPVVVMGDFLREEAKKRGMKFTAENLGKLMFQIRKEKGSDVIAKMTVEAIKKINNPVVLIDGIRSLEEVEEFKRNFKDFRLVAVKAREELRFKRISRRLRSDDIKVWKKFKERDKHELEVGVGKVIETADQTIHNNGTLKEFKNKIRKFLEEINLEVSFKRRS